LGDSEAELKLGLSEHGKPGKTTRDTKATEKTEWYRLRTMWPPKCSINATRITTPAHTLTLQQTAWI